MRKRTLEFISCLFLLALLAAPAAAQDPGTGAAPGETAAEAAQEPAGETPPPAGETPPATSFQHNVPFQESLMFSPAQVALMQSALASGKLPGTKILDTAPQTIPMKRVISLAGVVFRGAEDWIIWLNGQKVTPDSLLPEIVEIRVERERVYLKWFDIGINDVISISLRPHQTYDIVTGVLLPG